MPAKLFAYMILLLVIQSCSGHGIYLIHDPLTAEEHNDLALVYEGNGEYDLALHHLDVAVKKSPHAPTYLVNRGNLYLKMGKMEDALKNYNKSVSLDPLNVEGVNNLCYARVTGGLPVKECPRLIENIVNNVKSLSWKFFDTGGLVYLRLCMEGNARSMYGEALKRCEKCPEEVKVELGKKREKTFGTNKCKEGGLNEKAR